MFADCEDEPLLTVTMEDETRQSRQMPCDASGSQCELCTMDDLIQKGQAEKPMVLCTLANSKVEYYWKYDYEKSSHADMQHSIGFFSSFFLMIFEYLRFLFTPQLDFKVHFFVLIFEINMDLLGGCFFLPSHCEWRKLWFFLNFCSNLKKRKKKNRIGRRCINGPCHANNVVKHCGALPYWRCVSEVKVTGAAEQRRPAASVQTLWQPLQT